MDITRFSSSMPGRLVPVGSGHAFVPDPLPPPNSVVSPDLWPLIVESHRQLATLEGVGRYLPNPALLLRPLEDREAIQSSRMEGTYATPREYLLFELAPQEPTSADDRVNDWREVHNYRRALGAAVTSDLPLSLRLIRDLHRILLTGVRGKERAPGEFRRVAVAIGSPAQPRFVPPPAHELSTCLDQFERHLHEPRPTFDPLVECFLAHYQFEAIHPFLDGNGRVGRLLLVVMLQQRCGLTKPWLHMSPYFEAHREQYVDLLFNVSAQGDFQAWIEFCLRGVIGQCRDALRRCERLLQIKESFNQRLAQIPRGSKRLAQIVEMAFDSPFIGVASLKNKLQVKYQTAKADLTKLERAGILQPVPRHTPITYYSPEIFAVAYEDLGDAEH